MTRSAPSLQIPEMSLFGIAFPVGAAPSIFPMNYAALEDKLGYRFKNPDLLRQALTTPARTAGRKRASRTNAWNSWETPFCNWPSRNIFTFTFPRLRRGC